MTQTFTPTTRAIFITAALVVIITGMKLAASLLVPFLLAVFIAVISFPLMGNLQQKGLPKWLALSVVILLIIVIGTSLTILIGGSLTDFSKMVPEYQHKISTEWRYEMDWLNDHGILIADEIKEMIDPAAAMGLLSTILVGFGSVLTNSFLILLTVVFILLESSCVIDKVGSDELLTDKNSFSQVFVYKLRKYMSMKTLISIITGFVIALAMWIIGVDYPLLWGVMAFMLNFVPNIGSIIAAVPAVLLALVQLGLAQAFMVAGVYLAVNVIIGSVIEPRYMGKGVGLSTLVVFVSLVFWGWVLGPVGMLLSVPLTITVKLALDSKPEAKWLGRLLGPVEL